MSLAVQGAGTAVDEDVPTVTLLAGELALAPAES